MKKTLLILILLKSTIVFTTAQIYDSIVIKIYDNSGRTDSVILGAAETATQGIDTAFGEKDLLGVSYADLEIRSVQDTSDTLFTVCSPFKGNHELKKDIRPDIRDVFLFRIKAIDFPVIVRLAKYATYYPAYYSIIWSESCHCFDNLEYIPGNNISVDTMYTFYNLGELKLLYLEPFVMTKSAKSLNAINTPCGTDLIESINNKQINIYPNPCNNQLFIDAPDTKSGIIQITDITGRLIKTFKLDNGNTEINVSGVSGGYYLLSVIQNNQVIYKSTLIKQ
jgi:hypothetical protein